MNKAKKLIAMLLAGTMVVSAGAPVFAANEDAPPEMMGEIRNILKQAYVEEIPEEKLAKSTIDEILEGYQDPYTVYQTREQYEDFIDGIENEFSGIGVYIEMIEQGMMITSPIEGSPAKKAGLKEGDIIIGAGGYDLKGASYAEAAAKTMGEPGTKVMLKIKRGEEIFELEVTRAKIQVPEVTHEVLNNHIGYVDINTFGNETPKHFGDAVEALKKENVDSWIFDLRSNGGGYLWAARVLAGYFVDSKKVVVIKGREGESAETGVNLGDIGDGKVIVLINPYSASASEVLSGALKDYQKATFVGNLSFGKGSVQVMYPLSNNDMLKVTIDHFYSPNKNTINHVGVEPDINTRGFDALEVAKMLLSGDSTDMMDPRYKIGPQNFYIDDKLMRNEESFEMYAKLFQDDEFNYIDKTRIETLRDRWVKAKILGNIEDQTKWKNEIEKIRKAKGLEGEDPFFAEISAKAESEEMAE
jgi:carboxyl-terminal processing protease